MNPKGPEWTRQVRGRLSVSRIRTHPVNGDQHGREDRTRWDDLPVLHVLHPDSVQSLEVRVRIYWNRKDFPLFLTIIDIMEMVPRVSSNISFLTPYTHTHTHCTTNATSPVFTVFYRFVVPCI